MVSGAGKKDKGRARAFALLKANKLPEARKLLAQVCKDNPSDVESWFYLGALNGQLGRHGDAADCFQKVVARAPDNPQVHYNLGVARRDQGMFEKAAESFAVAARLSPGNVAVFRDLGFVLSECRRYRDAAAAFKQLITLIPQEPASYSNHADACLLAGDLCSAIDSLQQLVKLKPKVSSGYARLGDACFRLGELDTAIESYQEAVRLAPTDPACGSKLLSALNFCIEYPFPKLFTAARRWGMLHIRRATVTPGQRDLLRTGRKIRIGYMVGSAGMRDLSAHIRPLLQQYDNSRFDVYYYDDAPVSEVMGQFCNCSIEGMDPVAIAETVMADEIDILVDLSGHGGGNRLAVFAIQPAPVQISYLGYPYTTGLSSVQYRITDGYVDPKTDDIPLYTEELLRLDGCSFCYCPETTIALLGTEGRPDSDDVLRLGVVADLSALNNVFIAALRDILKVRCDVELHIFNSEILDKKVREHAGSRLAELGIPAEIVRWIPPGDSEDEQMAMYRHIDVLLDTMPISGLNAVCQALWMGVPVVTLAGERPSSRIGKSILETVGVPDLVVTSVDDYVGKVLELLEDRSGLLALHESLHQKVVDSALCNGPEFMRNIESVYMKISADILSA